MIGSSVGKTFSFSDPNASFTGVAPQNQQIGAPQGNYDDFIGKELENLENVEGMTRDYYAKWINLKSYAKTMWSNLNIDVTSPDLDNEESIRANNIYMKAVADLRNQGNRLKEGKNVSDAINKLRLEGKDILDINSDRNRESKYSDFSNIGLTEGDETVSKRVGVSVNTTGERDELMKHKDDYVRTLEQQLATETDPSTVRSLVERISTLREVIPTYDPTANLDRAQDERESLRRPVKGAGDEEVVANFQFFWKQLQDGVKSQDLTALRAFSNFDPNIKNARYVSDDDGTPYIEYDYQYRTNDAPQTRRINLNDNINGLRAAAEAAGESNEYGRGRLNQNKLINSYRGDIAINAEENKTNIAYLNEYLNEGLKGATISNERGYNEAQEKFNAPNMKMPPFALPDGDETKLISLGGEEIEGVHIYKKARGLFAPEKKYMLIKYKDSNGDKKEVEYEVNSKEEKELRRKLIAANAGVLLAHNKINKTTSGTNNAKPKEGTIDELNEEFPE